MIGIISSLVGLLAAAAIWLTKNSPAKQDNVSSTSPFQSSIAYQAESVASAQTSVHSDTSMGHMGLLFAQDKGAAYTLDSSEAQRIRDLKDFYGLQIWGFVMYRCTYGDDDAWSRFIGRLDRQRDHMLREYCKAPDLIDSYDWHFQEDTALEGATKDEVRRRFRRWVSAQAQTEIPAGLEDYKKQALMRENPRYNFCMHVDAEAMNSVLEQPDAYIANGAILSGHVNLVRADESWDLPDFDRFEWSSRFYTSQIQQHVESFDGNDEDDADDDEYDEGEPELEGSRLHDVGWMTVKVHSLIPEMYATLVKSYLWDKMYRRPPALVER